MDSTPWSRLLRASRPSPPLLPRRWADPEIPPTLEGLHGKVVAIFGFQARCQSCHALGFPLMAALEMAHGPETVQTVYLQTAFERLDANSFEAGLALVRHWKLRGAYGYDPGDPSATGGERWPRFMRDFHASGTPWLVLVDARSRIRRGGFIDDPEAVLDTVRLLVAESRR